MLVLHGKRQLASHLHEEWYIYGNVKHNVDNCHQASESLNIYLNFILEFFR